ncbi:hypothetical protein [Dactylosporangium sp. CS-033363]|uniref:hypothetical protein n=1 Tax=Dactylosporangium sp. CS-033363 TaxID=3239935 RepID=UPI003D8B57E5
MTWSRIRAASGADGNGVSLELPPGWWALPLAATDLDERIAALVAQQAEGLPEPVGAELTAEFERMTSTARTAGAVLLAGGAAAAGDDGRIVVASLLVAPYEAYRGADRPGWSQGPSARVALPAGTAVRHTWLGTGASPLGPVRQLDVEYVIAPPAPPSWVLAFRTPALRHVVMLLAAFDAIAGTMRPEGAAEPAPVFG